MAKITYWRILAVVLLTVFLAACGDDTDEDKASNNAPPAPEVTPATVHFMGVAPGLSYNGIYAGISQGYFDAEKLIVLDIYTTSSDDLSQQDVIERVLAGDAEFSAVGADRLLAARQEGKPLVAIAAIYQRDPTAIISLSTKGIISPQDLEGKRLLVWNAEVVFRLFAAEMGLDLSQIELVTFNDIDLMGAVSQFLAGQVDGVVAISTEIEPPLRARGINFRTIYLYEYGIAMYPNLIFTTEQMIQENPDVVQRFVNGFIQGMQYAVENPEAVATQFVKDYGDQLPSGRLASQSEVMLAMVPIIHTYGSEIGMMSPDTWKMIYEAMVKNGLIGSTSVNDAYTLRFVQAYHSP